MWLCLVQLGRVVGCGTHSAHPELFSFVRAGTVDTWLSGDGVWWVPHIVAAFSFCRSTVLLGDQSFFDATTFLKHQVVGVPAGTSSIILSEMSWLRSCFILSYQCWGKRIGVCTTDSVIPWTKVMSKGLLIITCNGWCGHVLNVLNLKWSCGHCSKQFLLLLIGGNGMLAGSSGAVILRGHPHNVFSLIVADKLILDVWFGKLWCIKSRSLMPAPKGRTWMCSVTQTTCFVSLQSTMIKTTDRDKRLSVVSLQCTRRVCL